MTFPRRTGRARGLAASLALLAATATGLAGCAGTAAQQTLTADQSPLMKLLGPVVGATDKDATRALERTAQKLVAECMTDAGFEYIPVDRSAAVAGGYDPAEQQSEDWIAKNGYGIASTGDTTQDEAADPNAEYIASLSEPQQQAYNAALYGEVSAVTPAEEDGSITIDETPSDPATAGCMSNAYREASGKVGKLAEDKKYVDLLKSVGELSTKAEKVAEVKAAASEWAGCMADAGHSDLKQKSDAVGYVSEQLSALYESVGGGTDSADSAGTPAEPSAADRKKLRDTEIKVALADFRCDKKTGYTAAQLKAQFALEDDFIADHRAELDQLIETYGNKK